MIMSSVARALPEGLGTGETSKHSCLRKWMMKPVQQVSDPVTKRERPEAESKGGNTTKLGEGGPMDKLESGGRAFIHSVARAPLLQKISTREGPISGPETTNELT